MKNIIIDSNFLCHKAKYVLGQNKHKNAIVYLFLYQVLKIAKFFDESPKRLIFLFDSDKRFSLRKKIYSNYKTKGSTDSETSVIYFSREIKRLELDILPKLGFRNIYSQKGHESDDLMAIITKKRPNKKFTIVTNDQDIFQLLSSNVDMLLSKKKKLLLFTEDEFKKIYKIKPSQWVLVKTIGGCRSDIIPAIADNVGEVTALKYVLGTLGKNTEVFKKIEKQINSPKFFRNYSLVNLPLSTTKDVRLKLDSFNKRDIQKLFEKWKFKSFLYPNIWNDWLRYVFVENKIGRIHIEKK